MAGTKYVIHFAKGALPPGQRVLVGHPLRFARVPCAESDRRLHARGSKQSETDVDGSLDIYLQRENPGADKEATWLSTPAQPFSLHARLYSPRTTAIDGTWAMPPVEKVK
jgi:hypothetical protein